MHFINKLYSSYSYNYHTVRSVINYLTQKRYYTISMDKGIKQKIAICQLTCKADKNENFNVSKKLITEAKKAGAKVIFNCVYFIFVK